MKRTVVLLKCVIVTTSILLTSACRTTQVKVNAFGPPDENHITVIRNFYENFASHNAEEMAKAYHVDAVFSDPIYPSLSAKGVALMWTMLCLPKPTDPSQPRIAVKNIKADSKHGYAEWDAYYVFSATNKPVHNQVKATFEFKDGKIIKHTDDFAFYKWSKMAFGVKGYMLGWTSFFKGKVQTEAHKKVLQPMGAKAFINGQSSRD